MLSCVLLFAAAAASKSKCQTPTVTVPLVSLPVVTLKTSNKQQQALGTFVLDINQIVLVSCYDVTRR